MGFASQDTLEAIIGISEGPIKGLVDGAKSFYLDKTPLVGENGDANFAGYELINYKGEYPAEPIVSRLGGFATSNEVGVELIKDTPVIRTGSQTEIDFIDFRILYNANYHSGKKSTKPNTVTLMLEYKTVSANKWTPIPTKKYSDDKFNSESKDAFWGDRLKDEDEEKYPSATDRPTFWSNEQPIVSERVAIWFDRNNGDRPRLFYENAWHVPDSLVQRPYGWSWFEDDEWGQGRMVRAYNLAKPTNPKSGDYFLKDPTAYIYNGSSYVTAGSTFSASTPMGDGTPGVIQMKLEITSPFLGEYRIPVKSVNEPYMVRVTNQSYITDDDTQQIQFESWQEVKKKAYQFDGLAVTQAVIQATGQLNGVPDLMGIYDGLICSVPSNYNPTTRVYTGFWDGLWKRAWTDNPAYIAREIAHNTIFGMSAYYPVNINKFDVYEFGQFCDVMINGKPRYTFSDVISEPRNGKEMMDYICGAAGGRFIDDGNGSARIKIDRDTPAKYIFAPENITEGLFNYSFTDINERFNDINVAFINPDLDWEEDRRRVFDQSEINAHNRVSTDFVAVGCTDPDEAIRRGRYKLATGITERVINTFRTNRVGIYLEPYDVILCCDPDLGQGLPGRIKAVTGNRTVSLRDPIYIEPGVSHVIKFPIPLNGAFSIAQLELTSGTSGLVTTLTTKTDLPDLPEMAQFTIEASTTGFPKAYRVMNVTAEDGNPDNLQITAVEVNRLKQAFVDGDIDDVNDTEITDNRKRPEPPGKIRLKVVEREGGRSTVEDFTLDWIKSPTRLVTRYRIYSSFNGAPRAYISETADLRYKILDAKPGDYTFYVTAVSLNGRESLPVSIGHTTNGEGGRDVIPANTIQMVDEPSNSIFESQAPTFRWAFTKGVYHGDFVVRIYSTGGTLLRTESVTENRFTYDYKRNVDDGGPRRSFKISVTVRNRMGDESNPLELTVSNPAAPAPTNVSLKQIGAGMLVSWDKADKRDVIATRVHVSNSAVFTPSPSNMVYSGLGNNVTVPIQGKKTYYVKIVHVDRFGETGLNYSATTSLTTPKTPYLDLTPPGMPTAITTTGGVGFIELAWTNPTDDDLSHIEIWRARSDQAFVDAKQVATSFGNRAISAGAKNGVTYQFWLRAVDYADNKSDFTAPVTGMVLFTNADDITDLAITAAKMADNAIQARSLVANAVTAAKIAANAVGPTQIAELAVSATKLADAAVTVNKLADNAVAAGKIAANAVTATQIAALAVNASKLAEGAVTVSKIGDAAVEMAKIADGAVSIDKIAANAIAANKIAANAIISSHISANAITAREIAADAVTADQIAANAVTATAILANAITAIKIAANAVTTDKVAANAITATEIASNAITARQIAADAVTANSLAANAVTAQAILANSITGVKIAANAITAREIATNTITAAQIAAGAIGADQIAANVITAKHIIAADTNNLIPDSVMADPSVWILGGSNPPTLGTTNVISSSGNKVLRIAMENPSAASGWFGQGYTALFPVSPGRPYACGTSFRPSGTDSAAGTAAMRVYWYQGDGSPSAITAFSGVTNRAVTGSNSATVGKGQVTAPSDAAFARVLFLIQATGGAGQTANGVVLFYNFYVYNAQGAELIVDGTIIGSHIAANAIVAAHIAANSITAREIATNTITATQIVAGTITATELATSSVTTSKITLNGVTVTRIADLATSEIIPRYNTSNTLLNNSIGEIELASWSYDLDYGRAQIVGTATFTMTGSTQVAVYLYRKVGSGSKTKVASFGNTGAGGLMTVAFSFYDNPGAGNVTYYVNALNPSGDNCRHFRTEMAIINFKR